MVSPKKMCELLTAVQKMFSSNDLDKKMNRQQHFSHSVLGHHVLGWVQWASPKSSQRVVTAGICSMRTGNCMALGEVHHCDGSVLSLGKSG